MDRTPQEQAASATHYLVDSAAEIAACKSELAKAENMLRVVKSLAMRSSGESSVAAQECEAYASPQYSDAIMKFAQCTMEYEKMRALREGAKMRIEYWRSLNANQRGAERGFGSAA